MDNDLFSQLLTRKACDADNRNTARNITLDLIHSTPIEQNRYWWTGKILPVCLDKDMNGWGLSQEQRLAMRVN